MLIKTIKINNHGLPKPEGITPTLKLDLNSLIKYYLDETCTSYDEEDEQIEIGRWTKKLQLTNEFAFRDQYIPKFTEAKNNFSNTWGRVLCKTILDRKLGYSHFAEFKENRKAKLGPNQYLALRKNKKLRNPDLICLKNNKSVAIAEAKGRLSRINRTHLDSFLKQCENGKLVDAVSKDPIRCKYWTIASQLSSRCAEASIIDPEVKGLEPGPYDFSDLIRQHYSRVLEAMKLYSPLFRINGLELSGDQIDPGMYSAILNSQGTEVPVVFATQPSYRYIDYEFGPRIRINPPLDRLVYCIKRRVLENVIGRYAKIKAILGQKPEGEMTEEDAQNGFCGDGTIVTFESRLNNIRKIEHL